MTTLSVAPFKTLKVKNNTSEWFDREITDNIHKRDKLYKRSKLTNYMFMKEHETQFKILFEKRKKQKNTKKSEKALESFKTIRSARRKETFY